MLIRLFNGIMSGRKIPNIWRKSYLVSIYKNIGDVQDCENHKDIKLMSHIMKMWEKIIKKSLRTTVSKTQLGFMLTIEPIFYMRQYRSIERRKETWRK